ncbi:DUF5693 family protein [Fervidobacterium islandicum]|uniref:DUF5693 family protein n=1 Tax=Fervidobacterium islandicum TaxID=2423 RepID=UPI003A6F9C3A
MKLPLFPRNEKYINIVLTVFALLVSVLVLLRIPNDKNNLTVSVFFTDDPSILFYTGHEKINDDVRLVIPLEGVEEKPEEFYKKIGERYVGIMEFYGDPNFVRAFYKITGYKKIVKVHYVKPKELPRYDSFSLFKRLWRAVVERSIEVIVLPRSKVVDEALKSFKDFFQVSSEVPSPDNTSWNSKVFGVLLGIYVGLQAPFSILAFAFFNNYWLFVSVMSILGTLAAYFASNNKFTKVANIFVLGLLTNFSLYSYEYLNDLEVYRGVKISLVTLPLIVGLLIFRNMYQKHSIKRWHVITAGVLGAVAITYMLMRSGNYGYVLDFEEKIRLTLENIFIIRPRIKELFFLPMFFIANDVENEFISGVLTFFGTFGFISIFNSFCHVKTPIYTVFYREITTVLVTLVIYLLFSVMRSLWLVWTNKK